MEAIAHLEWTIGIALIIAALINYQFDALAFFLLGIGSSFPDIYDVFAYSEFTEGHRDFSHTLIFIIILWLLSLIWHPLIFLMYGCVFHIIEDVIAGGSPIRLLSPFTQQGSIMLLSKEKTIRIGGRVRSLIKGSYVGSENIGDELSWFWLLTIIGTYILVLGIIVYFMG